MAVPDGDGNLPVPLRTTPNVGVRLLTGGSGPEYAHFTRQVRPGAGLAVDEYLLVAKATRSELVAHDLALADQQRAEGVGYAGPMSSWEATFLNIDARCRDSADGSVLFSLVFCHPRSVVLHDLRAEYAYLDRRSGPRWDLYFAGYRCAGGRATLPPSVAGIPLWRFDGDTFDDIRRRVQDEHARALARDDVDARAGWRYSGSPELVSFMAYRDYPGYIDWLSLRAVRLVDANNNYIDRSLSEIVEVLSDWRDRDDDAIRDLAPGEPPVVASGLAIGTALRATAATLVSGIAGNAAYELIKAVLG